MPSKAKIILASGSPRRAKILRDAGVEFEIEKTDAPEVSYPHEPERTVRENALAKGAAAAHRGRVLSADTIVWLDNRIYGKPRDLEEAKEFLRELSGRTHTVFTGVAFDGATQVVRSDVTFKRLSEETIEKYVAEVRPTDRAGAYDIDVSGDLLIASHSGSYENIMGLPLGPLVDWGIVPHPWSGIRSAAPAADRFPPLPAATTLVELLKANGLACATAESCTGGGIGAAITSVPGSSAVYLGGVVSYANSVKEHVLGVSAETLAAAGAVSSETAAQMADGARRLTGADIAVSVTGIAGPDGGTPEKPVGLVWFGLSTKKGTRTEKAIFPGDRETVRRLAVVHALGMLTVAAT